MFSQYLYCMEDEKRRCFKVGISNSISRRESEFPLLNMRVLFAIKISPIHFDDCGILNEFGHYIHPARTWSSPKCLQDGSRRHILRLEKLFKHKFKDSLFHGEEYFHWNAQNIAYVERIFKKYVECENTAVTKVEFINVKSQPF